MLNKCFKYIPERMIRAIAKVENGVTKKIYAACKIYSLAYLGFSYNPSENGEEQLIERIAHFVRQDKAVIFDVGSNVGDYLQLCIDKFSQFMAHGFEISEATFGNLSKRYSGKPNIILNNVGLLNTEALLTYKDYGINSGVNTTIIENDFHLGKPYDLKQATFTTGDQYCISEKIDQIDLLKIDVEGGEHLVLKGFSNMLEKQKIRVVQFEYGYANGDAHFLMKDFFRFFEEYGYVVAPLRKNGLTFAGFSYEYNNFMSGPNFVAIASSDIEMRDALAGG